MVHFLVIFSRQDYISLHMVSVEVKRILQKLSSLSKEEILTHLLGFVLTSSCKNHKSLTFLLFGQLLNKLSGFQRVFRALILERSPS